MKKSSLSIAISGLVIVLITPLVFLFFYFQPFFQAMPVQGKEPVIIQVEKNSGAYNLAKTLQDKGLIQSSKAFVRLIKLQAYTKKLKAGIYQLQANETAEHFLKRVVAGDVLKQNFTIIEGWNLKQLEQNLKNAAFLNSSTISWQQIAGPYPSAEGLLLADSYQYNAGSSSQDLLLRAKANLLHYLQQAWEHRDKRLPYSKPYELLIVASILEKEAASPEERRTISGIIVKRLQKHMRLQMDPTVLYGLEANSIKTAEALKVDSPYNTYMHHGLPPTPIAMVSRQSIDAAANPLWTNYLYFVAKNDGRHRFSENYQDHRQAIQYYLRGKNRR